MAASRKSSWMRVSVAFDIDIVGSGVTCRQRTSSRFVLSVRGYRLVLTLGGNEAFEWSQTEMLNLWLRGVSLQRTNENDNINASVRQVSNNAEQRHVEFMQIIVTEVLWLRHMSRIQPHGDGGSDQSDVTFTQLYFGRVARVQFRGPRPRRH